MFTRFVAHDVYLKYSEIICDVPFKVLVEEFGIPPLYVRKNLDWWILEIYPDRSKRCTLSKGEHAGEEYQPLRDVIWMIFL